jgi:pimeloyl-ACP methyl ester carboxylesterase
LIRELGPGPCHLVGSSYGSFVSLVTAAKHPELVRSLVVGEPPMFPLLRSDSEGAPFLQTFLETVWERSIRAFEAGELAEGARIFYEGITAPGAYERLTPSARNGMLENALPLRAEAISRVPFPEFSKEDAGRITCPCLLLVSERSPRIFHRITDLLAGLLPQAERARIPDSSHSMHTDNPKVYNDVVMDFLMRSSG